MARDAISFTDALGLSTIDLAGHSTAISESAAGCAAQDSPQASRIDALIGLARCRVSDRRSRKGARADGYSRDEVGACRSNRPSFV
jgi:hypothetical protein